MNNFKIGDVVILKSGGPAMTILVINKDGEVTCTWFNDGKRTERCNFPADSLKLHTPHVNTNLSMPQF